MIISKTLPKLSIPGYTESYGGITAQIRVNPY